MSKSTKTTCDYCGAVKREVNHWWNVGYRSGGKELAIFKSEEAAFDSRSLTDACSEKCVMTAVGKFLAGETLVMENNP